MLEINTKNIALSSGIFHCLSNEHRLKILGYTRDMEVSQATLTKLLNLSPSTVSVHVEKLRRNGLVTIRKDEYKNKYVKSIYRTLRIDILPPPTN